MKNGIYIYGFIKTTHPQTFGSIGIGNPPSPVSTLTFQHIAAVISPSPLTPYDSLPKETVLKHLVTHQFVIETVMRHFTIIPAKFGTLLNTTDEVLSFLHSGYSLLSHELDTMHLTIELDVVATWNLQTVLASITQHNAHIQHMQADLARKGTHASLEEKIELGKQVEQALLSHKKNLLTTISHTLQPHALNTRTHELVGDDMIFNAAFLLHTQQETSFTSLIHSLDLQLEHSLSFRIVGPLPPYSFSTILLEKINPSHLEAAKQVLGLHHDITEKTVRDAYHHLAQLYHPDTCTSQQPSHFPTITAAYTTLKQFVTHGLMRIEVYRWQTEGEPLPPS